MYSPYKLNKQGDNIQPWRTPFPIWNQSVVPCPVLTVASWPAYIQVSQKAGQAGQVYAEYITRNAGLDEAQAGIKIAGRNINNLRYADDTTLVAENEEELKSFLIKVKEESEKVGIKLNIQKTEITAPSPIT